MRTYQSLLTDYKTLSRDSSTANTTLGGILLNRYIKRILMTRDWTFNRSSKEITAVASQQAYYLPYNCERIKDIIVTVGEIKYFPQEVSDRKVWNNLNRTTVNSNSTSRYFIEADTIEVYPIPTNASPVIKLYYQKLTKDLGESDYTTGSPYVTTGSPTIVVSSPTTTTAWTSSMEDRHIQFGSDGYWYPIDTVASASQLTVSRAVNQAISGDDATYKISEMIPLPYGYDDLPLYGALFVYFNQKQESIEQAREYERLYREGLQNLLRRDAKSVGNVLEKDDLRNIVDVNRYPTDLD